MDPVSYDFTNDFEKNVFVSGAFRGDDQTYYTWYRWLLSVAKVPDRWKHIIKQYGYYNKYVTVFGH